MKILNQVILKILEFVKSHKVITLIIILGFILQMSVVFPYGKEKCIQGACGIFFADSSRAHDDLWYIAIATTSFKTFPFQTPIFAGTSLFGFPMLYEFIIFGLNKFFVNPFLSYYTVIPVAWFFIYTYLSIKVAKRIKDSWIFIGSFLFFQYFAGSFGFLINLYNYHSFWHPSLYTPFFSEPIAFLVNPQLAIASLFLLVTLYIILKNKLGRKDLIILFFVVFLSLETKFYTGAAILSLLFFDQLFLFLSKKQNVKKTLYALSVFFLSAGISIILFYNPFASFKTGGVFIWLPFTNVHQIIEDPGMLHLTKLVNARYFLYTQGFGPRLLAIELFSTFLFVVFALGTRVFGFLNILKRFFRKEANHFEASILLTIVILFGISVLFIQRGNFFDTKQFMGTGLLLANIFAAETLFILIGNKKALLKVLGVVMILLTVYDAIFAFVRYSSYHGSVYVSKSELTALNFLSKQKDGSVYELPAGKLYASDYYSKPLPVYQAVDSAYVSAFTGKQSWVVDSVMLKNTGIDFAQRNKNILDLNAVEAKYFYLNKSSLYYSGFFEKFKNKDEFRKIFENNLILIFEKK